MKLQDLEVGKEYRFGGDLLSTGIFKGVFEDGKWFEPTNEEAKTTYALDIRGLVGFPDDYALEVAEISISNNK